MDQIRIDDFLKFQFVSSLESNQAKTMLAYITSKVKLEKNEYHYQLWIYDGIKNQKISNLKNKSHYIFETNNTILYQKAMNKNDEKMFKDSKKTIYYRYDINTKNHEKAYVLPISCTIVKVLDKNKLLLSSFLSKEQHQLYQIDDTARKEVLKSHKDIQNYEDIEEIPFYFNGQGFISGKRSQLFIYLADTNQMIKIVDENFNIGQFRISDDHRFIYYTGQQMTGVRSLTTQVYRYDINLELTDMLYLGNEYAIRNIYLIDQELIIAASDMKSHGINQNPNFYILENKHMKLISTFGYSIGNSIGSDVRLGNHQTDFVYKNQVYFIKTTDDRSEIMTLSNKGELKHLYLYDGSIDSMTIWNDKLCIIGLHQQNLQEIYISDFQDIRFKKITRLNRILSNKYVAKPKEFIVKKEGFDIKGFALLPKGYDQNKTYPLILDIHGGPKTVYGKVYYHEMQVWANLGYVVCFCNPRGSDGKTDQFADIRGKYGTIDYEDIMDFLSFVMKKQRNIDQKALFVTGGSYGGFMTNWMIGHTHIFKAAATQRSISNWLSFHGTSDIGFYFSKDQTGGNPILDFEKLWNQSPIKYVDNIKTPLLLIHSDQDYRCPIEQAMQLFTNLKERQIDTKLVWIKGENHDLSRNGKPQARIKRLNEITSWFEKYKS